MDGKAMLMVFAALIGAAIYMGTQEITLGGEETGPSARPSRLSAVVDLRHNNIREALKRDGFDLDDPNSYVFDREGLSIVGGPVAATEHDRMVFLENVYPWYVYPRATATPSTLRTLDLLPGCHPTQPATGSRLANVFSGPTLQRVSIWAYREQELNDEADALIARVRAQGREESLSVLDQFAQKGKTTSTTYEKITDPYQLSVMEIVVTETETPVHLVLQSAHGRIMWNLSLAPGARISGVTMIGGDVVALSNLPRGVPVEVMTDEILTACNLAPARALLWSDPVFKALAHGEIEEAQARAEIEAHLPMIEEWNQWFVDHFGLRDDETRIGHDLGSIAAVVGPIPATEEETVGYHGFDRRPVYISPVYDTLLQSKMGPTGRFKLRVERRATERLGADLSTIAPAEIN